jgi:hypothetical protein
VNTKGLTLSDGLRDLERSRILACTSESMGRLIQIFCVLRYQHCLLLCCSNQTVDGHSVWVKRKWRDGWVGGTTTSQVKPWIDLICRSRFSVAIRSLLSMMSSSVWYKSTYATIVDTIDNISPHTSGRNDVILSTHDITVTLRRRDHDVTSSWRNGKISIHKSTSKLYRPRSVLLCRML